MSAAATGSSDGGTAARFTRRTFHWLWLALPLAVTAGLLALDRTRIDVALAALLYDPATRTFPLRTAFLFETVLHHWAKYVVASIAFLAWAGYFLTHVVPTLRPRRRELLFLGMALALVPAAVSILKLASDRHCPWDTAAFGGFAPYLALLEAAPAGLAPGHCFPAGHAATGFCLMAFYFIGWSARNPALARAGLATGLLAGLGLGFGRMMQGAHFLSHVLWSGIVCWIVLVALCAFVLRPASVDLQSAG